MLNLIRAIWIPITLSIVGIVCAYYISIIALVFTAIFAADSIGRVTDYRYLMNIKRENPIVIKSFWDLYSYTRCSREVMIQVDPESKEYYDLLGYRWYHFAPDDRVAVFNLIKPRYLLKKK